MLGADDIVFWWVGELPIYVARRRDGWIARAVEGDLVRIMNDELGLRDAVYASRSEAVRTVLALLDSHGVDPGYRRTPRPLRWVRQADGSWADEQGHWSAGRVEGGNWLIRPLSETAKAAVDDHPKMLIGDRRITKRTLLNVLATSLDWTEKFGSLAKRPAT
jgi:hypothetical protein